jgi:hypothetical protein
VRRLRRRFSIVGIRTLGSSVSEKMKYYYIIVASRVLILSLTTILSSCAYLGELTGDTYVFFVDGSQIQISPVALRCFGPISDGSRPALDRKKENRAMFEICVLKFLNINKNNVSQVIHVTRVYPAIGRCTEDRFKGIFYGGSLTDYSEERNYC